MLDFVIAAAVLLVVGLALRYVVKAKKSGKKCVGCPDGGCDCECTCGCGGSDKAKHTVN